MTDFPMDTVILNKIVEVFNQTRHYVLLLFPLAFFIRIAFGFIFLKGDVFTDLLKDSLFLFLGLFFFIDIFKFTLQIPYFVASELSMGDWRNINLGEGLFINTLKRIVDWIGIISYWISFWLYMVIISVLGFFAGYILFLGTMFRAYGLLKVFFILLFVVSLWPLLWYSINFAVYTIAVSDNALANNVIVGGASLAKVFLPLWIIFKTTKIPVSQNLQKISYFSGSLAGAAGSGAYSLVKDKTESVFKREEQLDKDNAEEVINITQTNEINNQEKEESFPYEAKSYIGEEDFSIKETYPEEGRDERETLFETNHSTVITKEKDTSSKEESPLFQENSISQENHLTQENHIKNTQENHVQNQVTKEIQGDSSSHIIHERKELVPQENFNESIPDKTEYQDPENHFEDSTMDKQSIKFNEDIHQKDWIENEESNIASLHEENTEETRNKEKESDL